MKYTKNEYVFPKNGGWIVRNDEIKKISISFQDRKEAIDYASMIALIDGGHVITHK